MPIRFSCPTCGKAFAAKDESAGKKTRCTNCQAIITIPVLAAAAKAPVAVPAGPYDLAPVSAPQPTAPAAGWTAPAAPERCPACRADLPANAVLCVKCGYNRTTGRHLAQDVGTPAPVGAFDVKDFARNIATNFFFIAHAGVIFLALVFACFGTHEFAGTMAGVYGFASLIVVLIGVVWALISVWPMVNWGTYVLGRLFPPIALGILLFSIAMNIKLFLRRLVFGVHAITLMACAFLLSTCALQGERLPPRSARAPEARAAEAPGPEASRPPAKPKGTRADPSSAPAMPIASSPAKVDPKPAYVPGLAALSDYTITMPDGEKLSASPGAPSLTVDVEMNGIRLLKVRLEISASPPSPPRDAAPAFIAADMPFIKTESTSGDSTLITYTGDKTFRLTITGTFKTSARVAVAPLFEKIAKSLARK